MIIFYLNNPINDQIEPCPYYPGTIVAINKAPTDAEDTDAKIIAFTFGGIIKPKGLEAAINAAKYALSYPSFPILAP